MILGGKMTKEDLTVSDLIDISRLKLDEFNLIVSGCGTGKSYFAINELINMVNKQFNKDIEGYEVWFVTSRTITKLQQLNDIKYKDNLKRLSEWGCELLTQSDNIKKDIIKLTNEFKNRIAIMTYNQFNMCIKDKLANKLKIIIFDECHALISDRSYITEMNNIRDFIRNTLNKKSNNTYFVGMTATDHLLQKEVFDININYLLDEPFFKYKVFNEVHANSYIFFDYILDNLTGKTIIMIDKVDKVIQLKEKYKEKCMIAISDKKELGKVYTKKYKDISKQDKNYIIKNKSLRDGVQLFVATSCSREGFEFDSEKIKIDNVIVCSQFPTDIIQFLGRYRGDIKNLYIFNKPFCDKNKLNIIELKQNDRFYNYIIKAYKGYFNDFEMFDDIKYKKVRKKDMDKQFKKYINENWTNKIIYNATQRNEILSHAKYLGLRYNNKEYTWNDILKSQLVRIKYKKDKARTTDEQLKECTNYCEVKDKKQISFVIFNKARVR